MTDAIATSGDRSSRTLDAARRLLQALVAIAYIALCVPGPAAFAQAKSVVSHTSSEAASASAESDTPVPVPKPSEKAIRYHDGNNYIWAIYQIGGILLPAIFVFTGWSARFRDFAQKLGRRWFFVVGIYCVLVLVLVFIVSLPFTYYVGFVRQHAYGLSNQSFFKWCKDTLIGLGIGCVMGFLFLWIPYGLGRLSPRRWWVYTGLLFVPFIFLQLLIWPIWVDPLFNHFGPMKDKHLEAQILALAERAGIKGGRVYEVDKSQDTKAINAYVTGLGATKRIVLWDTAIRALTPRELLVVMGHEMGHYVLGHVVKTICFLSVVVFVGLYFVYRLGEWAVARFAAQFRFDRLSDVASLPLIVLLINILSLVLGPVVLAYSRHNEHEADRFAVELTHYNHAAATAFVKIQQENLGVPRYSWLFKIWRASHPSIGARIDFFNNYKPWKKGQPSKYGYLFKPPKPSEKGQLPR